VPEVPPFFFGGSAFLVFLGSAFFFVFFFTIVAPSWKPGAFHRWFGQFCGKGISFYKNGTR
jgi:hypothetical protein